MAFASRRRRLPGWVRSAAGRRAARWTGPAAAALVGTDLGLRLGAVSDARIGPLQVRLRLRPGTLGGTVVAVPPLGTARLRTHAGTVALRATVTGIDPAAAKELVADLPAGDAQDAVVRRLRATAGADARRAGVRLAGRSVAAGLAGAAALAALGLRRGPDVLAATAISAASLAVSAALAAATVRRDAWRDPRLTGLLQQAPRLIGDLRTAPDRLGRYRRQLADLTRTAGRLHTRLLQLPQPPPADAIRVLHVSDVHLNPAAFDLMRAAIAEYDVRAVVDTGDLVDWGTPAESRLAGQIGALGLPYVFIRGNHDSAGTTAAVAGQPNAVVLAGGDPVEVAGLRFVGIADPRFTPDKRGGDDHVDPTALAATGRALAERITAHAAAGHRGVDVAMVHDPASAPPLAGVVPLVLAGHTHRRVSRRLGTTLLRVEGSTGGAGLRGVQAEPPVPLSASVLHLDRTTRRLVAVDEITVGGVGQASVSVVRELVQ